MERDKRFDLFLLILTLVHWEEFSDLFVLFTLIFDRTCHLSLTRVWWSLCVFGYVPRSKFTAVAMMCFLSFIHVLGVFHTLMAQRDANVQKDRKRRKKERIVKRASTLFLISLPHATFRAWRLYVERVWSKRKGWGEGGAERSKGPRYTICT